MPSWLSQPVVVTGGAGFVGTILVRQLLAAGAKDVRVVDVLPSREPGVQQHVLDLRDGVLAPAFDGARTVLHLAACQYHTPLARSTYDLPFFDVNVRGTERVLEASTRAGVTRLVFVSTNMVYGLPKQLPLEETHARSPIGPYGESKRDAEDLVLAARGAMQTSIVRPGLIVGPGRVGVVARVFDWILAGRPVWVIGGGHNRYELMHAEDVASLVLAAAAAPEGGTFNCGSRSVPTMRQWMQAVIDRTGSRSRIVAIPSLPLRSALRALETVRLAPLRADQYRIAHLDYFLDWSRAKATLGWEPKWTGLDAVLDTFRWYTSR